MATVLDVTQVVVEERQRVEAKRKEFRAKGKKFTLTRAGVVPDRIYNVLRPRTDDKYKAPRVAIRKIADGDRVHPVDMLVVHHSVGPEFRDVDHDTIAQWFSDIGRNRGYAGLAHSGHYYKGRETFAQAQLAGHWHGGKYCVFEIMDDVLNNVAWHAGNWPINQRSLGLENCGRYSSPADDAVLRGIADYWRAHDRRVNGNSYINPHRDVTTTSTACPERLGDQIPKIIEYVNGAPAPAPTPAPTYDFHAQVGKAKIVRTGGEGLWVQKGPHLNAASVVAVDEGTIMDFVGYVTNGDEVEGTRKWWKNAYGNYFSAAYADDIAPIPPTPPAPTPTPVDPKAEFIKKHGIDLKQGGTFYIKNDKTPLVDFQLILGTGTFFDKNHEFTAVGRTANGYMITKHSLDRLLTKGVSENALSPTPIVDPAPTPDPTPAPQPEKSLWQQLMELLEKIKKALGG